MPVHANLEPLRWESDFFGFSNGRLVFDPAAPPITVDALDAFKVVQAKVTANCPRRVDALMVLGFRQVEGETDLSVRLAPADGPDAAVCGSFVTAGIRLADGGDIPVLRQMASTAFSLSRFREPWYSGADNRRFYALWAENAVLGRFDHRCLVVGPPGGIIGMVTLRDISVDEVRIGLLSVDPAFGGRGIGRQLFNAALAWCREHHKKRLRVATQTGNIAALRLYIACGATIDSTAYWLYR